MEWRRQQAGTIRYGRPMAISSIVLLVMLVLAVITLVLGLSRRFQPTLVTGGLTVLVGVVYAALWFDLFSDIPAIPLVSLGLVVVGVLASLRGREA